MSFWGGMQLWQKMLMILSLTIAIVMTFGFAKVAWKRMQLRKHTKAAAKSKERLEEARQSRVVINLKTEEIPFGIRALEAGLEVEGVVVSRTATPRNSFKNFSNLTLLGPEAAGSASSLPSQTSGSRLSHPPSPGASNTLNGTAPTMQQLQPIYSANSYYGFPSSSGSGNSSPIATRRSSHEVLSSHHNSLAKLEGRVPMAYIPGQRKNTASPDDIRVPQVRTPSRSPSPSDALQLQSVPGGESNGYTAGCRIENEFPMRPRPMSHYIPQRAYTDNLTSTEPGNRDLSLLYSHRLSHAAEVGQLSRRPQPAPKQFTASQPNLTISGNVSPVGQTAPYDGYAIDIEPAISPISYHNLRHSLESPATDAESESAPHFQLSLLSTAAEAPSMSKSTTPSEKVDETEDLTKKSSKKLKKNRSSNLV